MASGSAGCPAARAMDAQVPPRAMASGAAGCPAAVRAVCRDSPAPKRRSRAPPPPEREPPAPGAPCQSCGCPGAAGTAGAAALAPEEEGSAAACSGPLDAPECPICQEDVSPGAAAMRCAGTAGRYHYFHRECLGRWIGACASRGAAPTCPVCRGPVQVRISKLSALLEGPQADALAAEERSTLQVLLDRARATLSGGACSDSDEWVEPFHLEDLAAAGAVTAAAAAGFYAGYSDGPGTGAVDVALLVAQDPYLKVAGGVGYVTGLVARGVEAVLSSDA